MIASTILKDVALIEEYDVLDLSDDYEAEVQGDFELPFVVDGIDSDDEGWIFYDENDVSVHLPYGHVVRVIID